MSFYDILHAIGLVLGFGGAVVSCVIMLDVNTDEKRLRRGRTARKICIATWIGLLLLIISGIGLTASFGKDYDSVFAIKHLCVAIILADASFIHFRFFPRYFRQIGTPDWNLTYKIMRRIGMLSMSCWIIAIFLSPFLGK